MRTLALALVVALAGCGGGPMTPLIGAARAGDTVEIARLAKAGVDLNAPGGVNNWSALEHAIHKNQVGSVGALLEAGAEPNLVSGRTTALIMAAGYGYADIVQVLLDRGANPRLAGPSGATPISAAIKGSSDIDRYTAGHCQTEAAKVLLERDPGLRADLNGGCPEVLTALGK